MPDVARVARHARRSTRVVVWTSVCAGLGLCSWQVYRAYARHRAKKAAASLHRGREIAENTELILAQLHDGPYSFLPPGSAFGSDDDRGFGIDDLDVAGSLSCTTQSSQCSRHSGEEPEGRGHAPNNIAGADQSASMRWMTEGEMDPVTRPHTDITSTRFAAATTAHGDHDHAEAMRFPQALTSNDMPASRLDAAEDSGMSTASPSASVPQAHKKRRGVKALISGVVAVLSSSEEDEREAEKVEVQQAAMTVSSKSFLHWAMGHHPPGSTTSRNGGVGTTRNLSGLTPFSVNTESAMGSAQVEPVMTPSATLVSGLTSTPCYPLSGDPANPHSAYLARQTSQVSGCLASPRAHNSEHLTSVSYALPDRQNGLVGADDSTGMRWSPRASSLDAHPSYRPVPAACATAASAHGHRRRHRPWWRRLWRVVRRSSMGLWQCVLLPVAVRPARAAWCAAALAWSTGWHALLCAPRQLPSWLSDPRRRAARATMRASPPKPADSVEAYLAPESDAVDVEAEVREIIDLLKPSPSNPARVPTVAVIRVPIGYEASLETERLLAALQLDSSSREDGLVDLYVIEELKTACLSLPPPPLTPAARSSAPELASPTTVLYAVDQGGPTTLWARRQSSPSMFARENDDSVRSPVSFATDGGQADAPSPSSRSTTQNVVPSPLSPRGGTAYTPLPQAIPERANMTAPTVEKAGGHATTSDRAPHRQRATVTAPGGLSDSDHGASDEERAEDPASRLKLTYEVYPAAVFYAFVLRCAVFQLKDDVTRAVAAKVFGGDTSSALMPEQSISAGCAMTADGGRSLPQTPFITCVSPMCAPYPAPQQPSPFHSAAAGVGGSAGTGAMHTQTSLGAFTLTSPSSRIAAGVPGGSSRGTGDSSPPSPVSARGARSTSMVFIDAMESLQAASVSGVMGVAVGGLPESSYSTTRRPGGRVETPHFQPSLPSAPLPPSGMATSSFQGTSLTLPPSAQAAGVPTHRMSQHDRRTDEPWGVCCMTVHVRSAHATEGGAAVSGPPRTHAQASTAVASPTAAVVGPFVLPPPVLAARAAQRGTTGVAPAEDGRAPGATPAATAATLLPPSSTKLATARALSESVATSIGQATSMSCGSPSMGPAAMMCSEYTFSAGGASLAGAPTTTTEMIDEPDVRVRYRTRLIAAGTHSAPALAKVDALLSRLRRQWWDVLLPLMQEASTPMMATSSLPAAHSASVRDGLDVSPRLRPRSPQSRSAAPPQPLRRPSILPLAGSSGLSSPLIAYMPNVLHSRKRQPRLGHLSSPFLSSTPDLRSTTTGAGVSRVKTALSLPVWALNSTLRRESMRETLMKELKERAFRILSIPLPDARVYRQLPPDVPRYIAAHARGFTLAHSFAQEILNQQRHLQRILIGLEQRHLRLQHRREERRRRRQEAWDALHGLFTLERSRSRPGAADQRLSTDQAAEMMCTPDGHVSVPSEDEDGPRGWREAYLSAAVDDSVNQPQEPRVTSSLSSSCTEGDDEPHALDATRRLVSIHPAHKSLLNVAGYEDGDAEEGGEVPNAHGHASAEAGAAPARTRTTKDRATVDSNGVNTGVRTPLLAVLGTPLALGMSDTSPPLVPSLPQSALTAPFSSTTTAAALAAAATVAAASTLVAVDNDSSTSHNGSLSHTSHVSHNTNAMDSSTASGAAGSGKRQGWTATNTSTNYNIAGKTASPGASLVDGATPAVGHTTAASTSPHASSSTPPLSSSIPAPSISAGWSPATSRLQATPPTQRTWPGVGATPPLPAGTNAPQSRKSKQTTGEGRCTTHGSWRTPPPTALCATNLSEQRLGDPMAEDLPRHTAHLSTPAASLNDEGTRTPLRSTNEDDTSSRRSQGTVLLVPNNSMYGTFDAYFGQSIASPQAVRMRHEAADLRRQDAMASSAHRRRITGGAENIVHAEPVRARSGLLPENEALSANRRSDDGIGGGALTAPASCTAMPQSPDGQRPSRSVTGAVGGRRSRTGKRRRPRYGSAAVLPYTYSNDSVSPVLGTNHYPLYAVTRELSRDARQNSSGTAMCGAPGNDGVHRYRGALHDLLGSGGGAMSSGITYYYTFGNATASLYNSCLRPTPESDPWERIVPAVHRRSANPGIADAMLSGSGVGGPSAGLFGAAASCTGSLPRNKASPAPAQAPDSAPPQAFGAGACDDGASSYLFMEPEEPNSSEEMVEEQTMLRQSRNQLFYSVYRHLHRVFTDTITTENGGQTGSASAPTRFGPAVPPDRAPLPGSAAAAPSSLPAMPASFDAETVTLGARTVARSELDQNNGHYGLEPLQVWLATRYSRRFAAEVYIMDVAACKSDRYYPAARVLDEVVEHAVLYYHDRRFSEFVEDLYANFGLKYTPKTRWGRFTLGLPLDEDDFMHTIEDPEKRDYIAAEAALHRAAMTPTDLDDAPPLSAAARRVLERQRRCGGVCEKAQEEDEGLFFSAFERTESFELGDEHSERLLLRELDHVKEFLLEHYRVLCSALQTDSGANSLEEVFGVPAMVFAFILCARESVALMDTTYHSIEGHYGRMTLENFSHFTHDVFSHDRPHIARHVTRIFRVLDKTRRGYFEYDELCWYMARKLSCGNNLAPDAHLLATAMSLRLPFILIIDQKYRWPGLLCTIASLSDNEMDY